MSEPLKQMPIGVTDFRLIREKNYLYVDKTELLYHLCQGPWSYFLSRPRGFGKTLLVDTLEHILRGHRELFKGLWIDGSDYDWSPNPVIRLSLNDLDSKSPKAVKSGLITALNSIAEKEALTLNGSNPSEVFKSIFDELYAKYNRNVAVLIDEYVAPITNQIENLKLADDIRKTLNTFYDVLKAKDNQRGFTLLTGESRFSPSTFDSALNNIFDLTFFEEYAAICGFTLQEFDKLFPENMENMLKIMISQGSMPPDATVSDLRQLFLDWYDGYSWDGQRRLLNPWSIIKAFDNNRFDYYWIQSDGMPSFLVKQLKTSVFRDLKSFKAKESITENTNVLELDKNLEPLPILFQSGYLTVDWVDEKTGSAEYFLKLPNLEVRQGIDKLILGLE